MELDVREGWGRKIARARETMQISQRRLADICDVDSATISRIERGEQAPSDALKWKLAGALGKSLDDLFQYPAVRPPFPEAVGQ